MRGSSTALLLVSLLSLGLASCGASSDNSSAPTQQSGLAAPAPQQELAAAESALAAATGLRFSIEDRQARASDDRGRVRILGWDKPIYEEFRRQHPDVRMGTVRDALLAYRDRADGVLRTLPRWTEATDLLNAKVDLAEQTLRRIQGTDARSTRPVPVAQ